MDKSGGCAVLNRLWSEAECTDKDGPIPSASRRDASVVVAMSCTTESSLRDSIIIYHAFPVTPLRSMAGYFQHALTGSDGKT